MCETRGEVGGELSRTCLKRFQKGIKNRMNGTEWDRMGQNGTEWDRMGISVILLLYSFGVHGIEAGCGPRILF